MRCAELKLRGTHNEANALAALALTAELTTDLDCCRSMCCVRSRACRIAASEWPSAAASTFVDDSKGTNVGATLAALKGLAGPLVLIAGGLSKGQDFAPLAAGARGKLRAAVLIGAAAADLARVLEPIAKTVHATSMDEAVARAAELAQRGDTVLLSPACASQDMFRDYRERGELFARAAQEFAAMSAVVKPNTVAFDAALICAVVGLIAMGTIVVTSASVSIVADEPLLLPRAPSRRRRPRSGRPRARRVAADRALVPR